MLMNVRTRMCVTDLNAVCCASDASSLPYAVPDECHWSAHAVLT